MRAYIISVFDFGFVPMISCRAKSKRAAASWFRERFPEVKAREISVSDETAPNYERNLTQARANTQKLLNTQTFEVRQ
jgi:hypothetical protein